MSKIWEYNLNSHVVYGSFDYGEVTADTEEEAYELAKKAINDEVKEMNEVLVQSKGGQSFGVDVSEVQIKLKFDLDEALDKMYKELNDTTIGGLVFKGVDFNGCVHLEFEDENECNTIIWCTPFWEDRDAICFAVHDYKGRDMSIDIPCRKPTSANEFEEWKKFYIGQLTVAQGKFASVDKCEVDMDKKTYTVSGYLVPKQTIKFDEFSDWNSLVGFNGNPIVDCQIDFDEEVTFQYVDYNFIIDAKLCDSEIDLCDTKVFGKSQYISRNYRDCKVLLVNEIEDCGVVQLIEVRHFKVNGIDYEIHVDATSGRNIIEAFCSLNDRQISDEVYDLINKAINKIDN